jgi:hypothetical protein
MKLVKRNLSTYAPHDIHSRVLIGSNVKESSLGFFFMVPINLLHSSYGILGQDSAIWFQRLFMPESLLLVSFNPQPTILAYNLHDPIDLNQFLLKMLPHWTPSSRSAS